MTWGKASFLIPFLFFFLSKPSYARNAFIDRAEAIEKEAQGAWEKLYAGKLDKSARESLEKQASERFSEIRDLLEPREEKKDGSLQKKVDEILDRMTVASRTYLEKTKSSLKEDFAAVSGTVVEKEGKESKQLTLERLDSSFAEVLLVNLRSVTPQNTAPLENVLELYETLAAAMSLTSSCLAFGHIEKVLTQDAFQLSWGEYKMYEEIMTPYMGIVNTLLPQMPDLQRLVSIAARLRLQDPKGKSEPYFDKLKTEQAEFIKEKFTPFVQSFADSFGRIAPDHIRRIETTTGKLVGALSGFTSYKFRFFPRHENDNEAMTQLYSALNGIGAEDCIFLANKKSTLSGQTCRMSRFRKGLNSFLETFDRHHRVALVHKASFFIHEFNSKVYNGDPKRRPTEDEKAWNKLEDNFALLSRDLPKSAQSTWPRYVEVLFEQREGKRAELEKRNLRERIEDREPALDLFMYLNRVLYSNELGLGALANADATQAFHSDFLAESQMASEVSKSLANNVEHWLEKDTRLSGEKDADKRLQNLEQRMGRVTMDRDSCKAYLNPKADDIEKAPYVVYATGFSPTMREVVDPTKARVEGSTANGYQRHVPLYDVRIGNAIQIQEVNRQRVRLAGLAVRYSTAMIVSNVAQTRALMGLSYDKQSIEAYGLKRVTSAPVAEVEKHYNFPDYKETLLSTEHAVTQMILGYGKDARNGLMRDRVQIQTDIYDAMWKENKTKYEDETAFREAMETKLRDEYNKRLNSEIDKEQRTKFRDVRDKFLEQYRIEMGRAAKALVKWNDILEKLKSKGAQDAPTILEDLFSNKVAPGQFHSPLEKVRLHLTNDPTGKTVSQEEKALRVELPNEVIGPLRLSYYRRTVDARARSVPADFRLSPDQFNEEFRRIGKDLVGSHLYYEWTKRLDEPKGADDWGGGNLPKAANAAAKGDGAPLQTIFPAVRMNDYANNIFFLRVAYIEQAKSLLFSRFPALGVGEAWRTFPENPSTETFNRTMQAYYNASVEEFNRLQRLGLDHADEAAAADEILRDVILNTPLLTGLLQKFPNFKAAICDEQNREDTRRAARTAIYGAVSMAAFPAVILLSPVLIPTAPAWAPVAVAGTVSAGISVGGQVAETLRFREAFENAQNWTAAVSPSQDFDEYLQSQASLRDVERMYYESVAQTAVVTALSLPALLPGAGVALHQAGRSVGAIALGSARFVRGLTFAQIRAGWTRAAGLMSYYHGRWIGDALYAGARQYTRLQAAVVARGWADPTAHLKNFMFKRFTNFYYAIRYDPYQYMNSFGPLQLAGDVTRTVGGFALDVVGNLPFSLLCRHWATTGWRSWAPITIDGVFFTGPLVWSIGHSVYGYLSGAVRDEILRTGVWNRIEQHPERYAFLRRYVDGGWISNMDLQMIVLLSDEDNETYYRHVRAAANRNLPAEARETARENLQRLLTATETEIRDIETAGNAFSNRNYFVAQMRLRHLQAAVVNGQ